MDLAIKLLAKSAFIRMISLSMNQVIGGEESAIQNCSQQCLLLRFVFGQLGYGDPRMHKRGSGKGFAGLCHVHDMLLPAFRDTLLHFLDWACQDLDGKAIYISKPIPFVPSPPYSLQSLENYPTWARGRRLE